VALVVLLSYNPTLQGPIIFIKNSIIALINLLYN